LFPFAGDTAEKIRRASDSSEQKRRGEQRRAAGRCFETLRNNATPLCLVQRLFVTLLPMRQFTTASRQENFGGAAIAIVVV